MFKHILFVITVSTLLSACKIQIATPYGGGVGTTSGVYNCTPMDVCDVEVVDIFFSEEFIATPAEGFSFAGWERKERGFCGGSTGSCALSTEGFEGQDVLLALLNDPEEIFFLSPTFLPTIEQFTADWLTGRIFYDVAFVGSGDESSPDTLEIVSFEFGTGGTVRVEGIVNADFVEEISFSVSDDGLLYLDDSTEFGFRICEIAPDYLKLEFLEEGEVDNIELFFYERDKAIAYAENSEGFIPSCAKDDNAG
jgi:hypothetical protein